MREANTFVPTASPVSEPSPQRPVANAQSEVAAAPLFERTLLQLALDLGALCKFRVGLLVLVTVLVGFLLATPAGSVDFIQLIHVLVGAWLLACGSSVLNQVMECKLDRLMARTEARPLPAGRCSVRKALHAGLLFCLVGFVYLLLTVNDLTAALGMFTVVVYVLLYTPLKRSTTYSLFIGAVAGALPPVMGWAAYQGSLGTGAWFLFAMLFLWQIPHFHSIAWLYRTEYGRAGFRMLAVVDPTGRKVAVESVAYTIALLAASCGPVYFGLADSRFLWAAVPLGGTFLLAAVWFARTRSASSARILRHASLLYLPGLLLLWVVTST